MALSIVVNGVDVTADVRLPWRVSTEAHRGSVGAGSLIVDDTSGTGDPAPAMKAWYIEESLATPTRLAGGYIAEREIDRGPLTVGTQRQWKPILEDWNAALRDRVLMGGAQGKRPEETDRARVLWLLSTGALAHVVKGSVPNTDNVTMPEAQYGGKSPIDVLEECAQAAGKDFWVYEGGSGPRLFYGTAPTTSSWTSSLSISDDPADVNSTTVFAPSEISYERDPLRVKSTFVIRYASGWVRKTKDATRSTFRRRDKFVRRNRFKTAAQARTWASRQLDQVDTESYRLQLAVAVPAASAGAIRAGQRIQIKLRSRGITSFTYWRIVGLDITPRPGIQTSSDVAYLLRLRLRDRTTLPSTDPNDDDSPPVGLDGARYRLDDWDRTASSSWGTLPVTSTTDAPWAGGNAWVTSYVGSGSYGTDGNLGYAQAAADGFSFSATVSSDSPDDPSDEPWGPWAEGDWMFEDRFRFSHLGDVGDANANQIDWYTNVSGWQGMVSLLLGDDVTRTGISNGQRGLRLLQTTPSSTDVTFAVKSIAADTYYRLRVDARGRRCKVKMWADGTAEPVAWDIDVAKVTPGIAGEPYVAATATGRADPASNTYVMAMPSGVGEGDLLLAWLIHSGDHAGESDPTGWTLGGSSAVSSFLRFRVFWKPSDGTEASATYSKTSADYAAWVVQRIEGWDGVAPEFVVPGGWTFGTTLDEPAITPSWGLDDMLVLVGAYWRYSDRDLVSYPSGYTSDQTDQGSPEPPVGGSGCRIALASRAVNAASEDPGTFVTDAINYINGVTCAVRAGTSGLGAALPDQSQFEIAAALNTTPGNMRFETDWIDAWVGGDDVERIEGETLAPGDGTTATWVMSPWQRGSLRVYVDGLLTAPSSRTRTTGTFTFDRAPASGAVITVDYVPA